MKPLLAIVCLNLGFCQSITEHWRISQALKAHRASEAEFQIRFASQINEFNRYSKP